MTINFFLFFFAVELWFLAWRGCGNQIEGVWGSASCELCAFTSVIFCFKVETFCMVCCAGRVAYVVGVRAPQKVKNRCCSGIVDNRHRGTFMSMSKHFIHFQFSLFLTRQLVDISSICVLPISYWYLVRILLITRDWRSKTLFRSYWLPSNHVQNLDTCQGPNPQTEILETVTKKDTT